MWGFGRTSWIILFLRKGLHCRFWLSPAERLLYKLHCIPGVALGIWDSMSLRKMWPSILLHCRAGWLSPAVTFLKVPEHTRMPLYCIQSVNFYVCRDMSYRPWSMHQKLFPSLPNDVSLLCHGLHFPLAISAQSVLLNPLFLLCAFGEQGMPYFSFPWETQRMPQWFGLGSPLCGGPEAGREQIPIRGVGTGGLENGLTSQQWGEVWSARKRIVLQNHRINQVGKDL